MQSFSHLEKKQKQTKNQIKKNLSFIALHTTDFDPTAESTTLQMV